MKRIVGGAAILAAVMVAAPLQAVAQRGYLPMRAMMGDSIRGPGVEMILRQREQLELTSNQIEQLERLRQETVQRRTAHRAQMDEMRSKVRVGDMKVEELRAAAEAQRTAAVEVRKQQQERIDAVLDDAQMQKIEQWRGQARAFRMGRMSAMRGQRQGMRGGRGGRGFRGRPGLMRWDGFGPGMQQQRPWGRGGPG